MKKLLLASAIVLGSYSFASAQAADVAQPPAQSVAAPKPKLSTKEQAYNAEVKTTTSKRTATAAQKQAIAARKAKAAPAAKKD